MWITEYHLQGHFGGWVCQGIDDTLPESLIAPQPVSFVCPVSLAVLPRHLPPRQICADYCEDPIDHRAMVMPWPPRRRLLWRE